MNTLAQAKLRAGAMHLGISLVIFLIIVPFIYFAWYPQPYFSAAGGWHGIKIVAAVDLVLGPVLTLIIFNPSKSRKAFIVDYSFIITCQIAALIWGVYAVHSQRPIVVAYSDGIFQAVTADAFEEQDSETLTFNQLSTLHPPLVYSREPENSDEKKGIVMFGFVGGIAKHELAYLYASLPKNMDKLLERREVKIKLLRQDNSASKKLDILLENQNLQIEDIVAIEFVGRYGDAWMILSNSGELIDVI